MSYWFLATMTDIQFLQVHLFCLVGRKTCLFLVFKANIQTFIQLYHCAIFEQSDMAAPLGKCRAYFTIINQIRIHWDYFESLPDALIRYFQLHDFHWCSFHCYQMLQFYEDLLFVYSAFKVRFRIFENEWHCEHKKWPRSLRALYPYYEQCFATHTALFGGATSLCFSKRPK